MEKINISFAGCGFLGIYHIGVASCIKEYAPHLLLNKISGASIGALAGCCLLCDVPLGTFTSEMLQIIYEIRRRTLGPFNPLVNVQTLLRNTLANTMPSNAHAIVSGKLFVSMTRVNDGSNYIVSDFKSNEELIDALLASAFVPIFSGFIPPKFGEYRYIDGGFSNNLPILDENTITVSPFCGESDICPRDSSLQLFHINLCNTSVEVSKPNIYRFARILFPPSPEVLSMMCKQGFDDALKFLQRNDMISCTKCLAVQTTIPQLPLLKASKHRRSHSLTSEAIDAYDPECEECVKHKLKAAASDLPYHVLTNFEHAIETANRGLANWFLNHRGIKIISILGLPYILTADIIRATIRKVIEITPEVIENAVVFAKFLAEVLLQMLAKMNRTGVVIASKVLGPLSISVYLDEKGIIYGHPKEIPAKHKPSFHITFDSNIQVEKLEKEKHEPMEVEAAGEEMPTINLGVDLDSYEHVLDVIEHHDALMAFYYMDDQNKMKVMEFFDVTNDDKVMEEVERAPADPVPSTSNVEAVAAGSRVADEDNIYESWTLGNDVNLATSYVTPREYDEDGQSGASTCEFADEPINVPSDPESEWGRMKEVILPTGGGGGGGSNGTDNNKPESDQQQQRPRKKSFRKSSNASTFASSTERKKQ